MTKFILHGGYTRENNESNKSFFQEFLKDVPENGEVLLVYFASETEEAKRISSETHIERCQENSQGKKLNITIATKENFLDEIKRAHAILFNGGRTKILMEALKEYPDIRSFVQGKTVAGSSAGAYTLASFGSAHSEERVKEGLGLVPVRVICHYESLKQPPTPKSVELLRNTRQDLELVILRDYEWKVFDQFV